MTNVEAIKHHLEIVSKFLREMRAREDMVYNSVEEFTLKLGIECKPAPLVDKVYHNTPKMCFQNALLLAIERPDLTYVEGYIYRNLIPINHAWCITDDLTVVDPTLDKPEEYGYFGVPMNTEFVLDYVQEKGTYGVVDDWEHKFPMLRGVYKTEDFLKEMS